jgi:hypothetical protein
LNEQLDAYKQNLNHKIQDNTHNLHEKTIVSNDDESTLPSPTSLILTNLNCNKKEGEEAYQSSNNKKTEYVQIYNYSVQAYKHT